MFDDFQIRSQFTVRGITDEKVLHAIKKVPRDRFVPQKFRDQAYEDSPLPIGEGQTISQPYIVAFMTEALELTCDSKVLEIGTGSGYQTAVLAEIAREVCTVEIVKPLACEAKSRLKELGYKNIRFKTGDGSYGWGEGESFDAVIVTAAPNYIPEELLKELKVGGRAIIPVGEFNQQLLEVVKGAYGVIKRDLLSVRFVPMTGAVLK